MARKKPDGVGETEAAGAGASREQLTVEQKQARWLSLWAFGTSPHGLGLESKAFWCLVRPEYDALKRIHDDQLRRWAVQQAGVYNATVPAGEPSFIADDFLGKTNRAQRVKQANKDRADVLARTLKLARMKKGDVPADLPAWAR